MAKRVSSEVTDAIRFWMRQFAVFARSVTKFADVLFDMQA